MNLSGNQIAVIIEVMERAVAAGTLDQSWLTSVAAELQPKPVAAKPERKQRPITADQKGFLQALMRHHGWRRSSGWSWGTRSDTIRVAEQLVKRGLVLKFDGQSETFYEAVEGLAYEAVNA